MVSVNAQSSPDYTQQLITLQNELNLINNSIGNLGVLTESNFDYNMDWLFDIMLGPADSQTGNRPSVSNTKNIVALLQAINSGVRRQSDVLASNPWWNTNSAFVLTKGYYAQVYPDEPTHGNYAFSFPQFMSKWSGSLTMPLSSATMSTAEWNNRWNWTESRFPRNYPNAANPYTWFDWMTEAMRSNIQQVATSQLYPSQSEASNSVQALYDSYSEEFNTNAVPETPEFEVEVRNVTGFDSISTPMEDFISDLAPPTTGGDSEIVVLPSFDLGGIHTQQYKFDFATSITPYCRGIMSFIWAVMGGAMIFRLLSGEWAFYTSLGRSTR